MAMGHDGGVFEPLGRAKVFVTATAVAVACSTCATLLVEPFEQGRGPCPIHRLCNVEAVPASDHSPERSPTGGSIFLSGLTVSGTTTSTSAVPFASRKGSL